MSATPSRLPICAFEDILDGTGVCALVGADQVALFRVRDELFAIDNFDPASGANVLARGIVGDLQGELVVASPVYKQHYSLRTGRCLEDDAVGLRVWRCGVHEGVAWLEPPLREQPPRHAARRQLVVVGNGMAAMRTVEQLLADAPDAYDITIFGAEPRGNYNRILLSPLLAGEQDRVDIELHALQWYREQGITLHAGDAVVQIDRQRRRVISAAGRAVRYDRLLLATGSDPVSLEVPGRDLAGITTFRSLDDVDAMLAAARQGGRAVVIGGGLLGLEAANGLLRQGMQVTVVHLPGRVMERQLDDEAAALLRARMESRGIEFCLDAQTAAFAGEARVSAVLLRDGRHLPADLVVIAAGIRPRVQLARDCGLRCDRGILVDDTLQTFDPAIYAVGECVQHRGATYGLVAPLWEQARVCAAHLAERGVARYRGSRPAAQLKVSGIDVFSAGDISLAAQGETLRYRDHRQGIYKRLVVQDNQLRAAVLFGDTRNAAWYADLIEHRTDIAPFRNRMLLGGVRAEPGV